MAATRRSTPRKPRNRPSPAAAGEDLPTLAVDGRHAIAEALTALGFTASNGEAKRKIAEGAVRLDDAVVSDPAMAAAPGKLSLGKKKHGLLL